MHFSLVMGTVGRTSELRRFLASLDAQTYKKFKLIVVDQNSDDRLVPLLEAYSDTFPITHLKAQQSGLSRARNIGIEHASGDIIAFPDDDCWYPSDLLREVAQFFASDLGIAGLTGRLTDDKGHDVLGRFHMRAGPIEESNAWARGIESTTFLRRSYIKDLRFDESLGLGSGTPWSGGEGTDYLLRLLTIGRVLYYDPEIVVIHPPVTALPHTEASQKAYQYGCGMGRVLLKHKAPLRSKAKWLIRPLGGTVLSLISLKPAKARLHYNSFKGRLRGMLS